MAAPGSSVDKSTDAYLYLDYSHHEIHEGSHYNLTYSVTSVGDLAAPDDLMTLSFTTPNTDKQIHFQARAVGPAGSRIRFIKGKTGAGASPTGVLTMNNNNHRSSNTSAISDVAGANEGSVSYDATLFTGGVTMYEEYLGGSSGPMTSAAQARSESEVILAKNTVYQLSLYSVTTTAASLIMSWYEHTPYPDR